MLLDSDRYRMQHMLEAARQAMSFIEGRKRVDLDTVWKTARESLPELIPLLEDILGAEATE